MVAIEEVKCGSNNEAAHKLKVAKGKERHKWIENKN